MKKLSGIMMAVGMVLLFALVSAQAAPVENLIPYSKDISSRYPRMYTMIFSLWDDATGGTMVWSEQKRIRLESSKLTTYLGDNEPLDFVDFSQQLWVQVDILSADGITTRPVGSRDRLNVAPYALWSPSSVGPEGPAGPAGAEGPQGPAGVSGLVVVSVASTLDSTSPKTVTASCSGTQHALGGGGFVTAGGTAVAIQSSYPTGGSPATGWEVIAFEANNLAGNWSVTAYAICADTN